MHNHRLKQMKPLLDIFPRLLLAALFLFPSLPASLNTHDPHQAVGKEILSGLRTRPDSSTFTLPEGWALAGSESLPKSVKLMAIGKGKKEFPPSLNLATEVYSGTLQSYLNLVKEINKSQGNSYKSLGPIETSAGKGRLCQVDTVTEWGSIRMLHAFVLKEGVMNIITAAASREEFSQFRPIFLKAMKSLQVNGDVFKMVTDPQRKALLEKACTQIKEEWAYTRSCTGDAQEGSTQDPCHEGPLQQQIWISFKEKVSKEFGDMGPYWQEAFFSNIQKELLILENFSPLGEEETSNNTASSLQKQAVDGV